MIEEEESILDSPRERQVIEEEEDSNSDVIIVDIGS